MKRNILTDANDIIHAARPEKYGRVEESYAKIAAICNSIFSKEEKAGPFTPQMVAKVLVAMKLVRDSYSPENPDHLTDAAGYLGLLDQLRQAQESQPVPAVEECPAPWQDDDGPDYAAADVDPDAHDMDEECATCGQRWGSHCGDRCPNEEGTYDDRDPRRFRSYTPRRFSPL